MRRLSIMMLSAITLILLSACQITSIEIIARENAREALNLLDEKREDTIEVETLSYEGWLFSYKREDTELEGYNHFNEELVLYDVHFSENDQDLYALIVYFYMYDSKEDRERPDDDEFEIVVFDDKQEYEEEKAIRHETFESYVASFKDFYEEDESHMEHDEITFDEEEIKAFIE